MQAVPPRRGQRVKSLILPPFNGGLAFTLVNVNTDAGDQYGVLQRRGKQSSHVWLNFDVLPTTIANDRIGIVSIPNAPVQAYDEFEAVIGGVGKHVRWNVLMPNNKKTGRVDLRVEDIFDKRLFEEFVANVIRPFGLCLFEYDGDCTIVQVPDVKNMGMVAAALHCAGYRARPEDATFASNSKLAIERYDRSEHMWWNQEQNKAGPLRDVHRWVFDFLPSSWKTIPFTWQSMCMNIDIDPHTESDALPLPLRDFYLTLHIQKLRDEGGDTSRLETLRGRPSVTCRLSLAQNRQLLAASYWNLTAPFDAKTAEMCHILRFRYMLNGYTAREIGGYVQNATNLGHGANIRRFRHRPQYRRENLNTDVLNKIYQSDGSLRGSGFKGTRGKYGHKDFPQYTPAKRMKRSTVQERRMRQASCNVFQAYHSATRAETKTEQEDDASYE
tara:strand:+ start:126 stop:1451 length:1326 start_codon:yes stop_codon:yes gene_type:complete